MVARDSLLNNVTSYFPRQNVWAFSPWVDIRGSLSSFMVLHIKEESRHGRWFRFNSSWRFRGNDVRTADAWLNLALLDRLPGAWRLSNGDCLFLKHPETKHGGAPGKAGGGKKAKNEKFSSFAQDTADKTGLSKRAIEISIRRADKIAPEVMDAIGDMPEI
jgi:hypothetical protein